MDAPSERKYHTPDTVAANPAYKPADRVPGNAERIDAGMGREARRHDKEVTHRTSGPGS